MLSTCAVCCLPGNTILLCVGILSYCVLFTRDYYPTVCCLPGTPILLCVVYQEPLFYCVLFTRDHYPIVCCLPGTTSYCTVCRFLQISSNISSNIALHVHTYLTHTHTHTLCTRTYTLTIHSVYCILCCVSRDIFCVGSMVWYCPVSVVLQDEQVR